MMRSVDYLRSRADILGDKIGYTGKSYGSSFGPVVLALEPRLKAAVLLDGGQSGGTPNRRPIRTSLLLA